MDTGSPEDASLCHDGIIAAPVASKLSADLIKIWESGRLRHLLPLQIRIPALAYGAQLMVESFDPELQHQRRTMFGPLPLLGLARSLTHDLMDH